MLKGISFLLLAGIFQSVNGFCGFYVAKAGSELFNEKSEVIMVRDGNKMTITMSNDFKGNVKDFAMVVPVPVVLKKEQIRIKNNRLFKVFNEYSAPRLVEYYDQNPCNKDELDRTTSVTLCYKESVVMEATNVRKSTGVVVEAEYKIGEYDIQILSAKESGGLKEYLLANGYALPANAEEVLEPYIKNKLKFFVVKVNLTAFQKSQFQSLNPLQIEFESEKFMLPIRLGMANSTGEQDLLIYAITRNGAVETSNYRTVRMETGNHIPTFVKSHFGDFYKDLFRREHQKENKNTVFMEYAWDVTPWFGVKCDPCVGNPPMFNDLIDAGVTWLDANNSQPQAFFTRLHVRYSRDKHPEDLIFITTKNNENFQARYVITWPASGSMDCEEGVQYSASLSERRKREVIELAALTGWDANALNNYIKDGTDPLNNKTPIKNEDDSKKGGLIIFPKGGNPSGPWIFLMISLTITAIWIYFSTKKKVRFS